MSVDAADLPTASSLTGAEILAGVQDGGAVKVTAEQIAAYAADQVPDAIGIGEAPTDGTAYARQDGEWVEVPTGGSDVAASLAASDGATEVGYGERTVADRLSDEVSLLDYLPAATVAAVKAGTQTAALDSYFEDALGDLPSSGGRLRVPAGRIPLFRVDVPHDNITITAERGTKFVRQAVSAVNNGIGSDGLDRGIFIVDGKHGFTIEMNGATVDLNGEGPKNIGAGGGRFANLYLVTPVPTIYGLAGPANAFIYARGANRGRVLGPFSIGNTGENAILLVNCGDWLIDGVGKSEIYNVANYGVEILYNTAAGGMQATPLLGNNTVRGISFHDINDYSLGALNGVGVGGGAGGSQVVSGTTYAENLGYIRGEHVLDNDFTNCVRDVQFEVPYAPAPGETGTVMFAGSVLNNTSRDAGQLSGAFIGCQHWRIDNHVALNPSAAVVPMLGPNWPSSAGLYISSRCDGTSIGKGCRIIETHSIKSNKHTDGVVSSGNKARITSSSMSATEAYIGEKIGIKGIGPSGGQVHHEAVITAVPDAHTIDYSPAAPMSGSSLTFAFGRACREGVVDLEAGVTQISGIIIAGTASGVTSEPAARGIRMHQVDAGSMIDATIIAPSNAGTQPTGISIDGGIGIKIQQMPSGFTAAFALNNGPVDLKLPSALTGVDQDNSQTWGNTYTITFQLDNIPASSSALNLLRNASPAADKAVLPFAARPVAQNVILTAPPTGSFAFYFTMGGSGQTALNVTETEISGGFRWGGKDRASYDAPIFDKGTVIESLVNTGATWVPTTDAFVELIFDRGS